MGNTSGRDRQQKGDFHQLQSPAKDDGGAQIVISNRNSATRREHSLTYQSSNEDEGPNFTKDIKGVAADEVSAAVRQRSATITQGTQVTEPMFPTVFKWDGGGKQVEISGTFSNWKTIPMVKSHGDFVTIIDLPEGEHQFKYCVDGEWLYDPSCRTIESESGSKTNMVSVKNQDFEVFQALAADSEITSANQTPIGDYGQTLPSGVSWEQSSGPPILPPHLLQVILNKDVAMSSEPTLLPEPNHVMLNHLYALSIKDGVMVLSATHRYKKKYVTTLLYKPI